MLERRNILQRRRNNVKVNTRVYPTEHHTIGNTLGGEASVAKVLGRRIIIKGGIHDEVAMDDDRGREIEIGTLSNIHRPSPTYYSNRII